MSARALADFLRSKRDRLLPSDIGLATANPARRTPGLRREEAAARSRMSTEYYPDRAGPRLDRMTDTAVVILDAKQEVIGWNALATLLFHDFAQRSPAERNVARQIFLPKAGPGDTSE